MCPYREGRSKTNSSQKNAKESTKELLELLNKLSKMAGYRIKCTQINYILWTSK